MSPPLLLSFKNIVSVRQEEADLIFTSDRGSWRWQVLSAGWKSAWQMLAHSSATWDDLTDVVVAGGGAADLPVLYYYLHQLIQQGLICQTLLVDGSPLATLVPFSHNFNWQWQEINPSHSYRLSRFAYSHQEDGKILWESPLFPVKLLLHDWRGGAIIAQLAEGQKADNLAAIPGLSHRSIRHFLSLLWSAKMLVEVGDDGKTREDEAETLAMWEFHDLLFHSRVREGRNPGIIGKSYRFLGKIPPLEAVKPVVATKMVPLWMPDLQKCMATDIPLAQAMEERQSIRQYGDKPITAEQLGEFLYRVARVRQMLPQEPQALSSRPYPSGGALYELELYLAINHCENLEAGLYHYCPLTHRLGLVRQRNESVEKLWQDAARAAAYPQGQPQVLVIIAARFGRVSWAYESIAYSLILKHVGVLQQTMYLVATAMGLAGCALGAGNADLFANTAGLDYYAESSVGEFILGSRGEK